MFDDEYDSRRCNELICEPFRIMKYGTPRVSVSSNTNIHLIYVC